MNAVIERTCQQCGVIYQTYPSIRLQFCSSGCAGQAKRRGGGLIACAVCGKEVYSFPSRPRRYCGKSCARTALNLTAANPSYTRDMTGANNPMYKGGKSGAPVLQTPRDKSGANNSMYGERRSGPDNPMYGKRKEQAPRWKGGRKVRKDGYTFVVAPDAHPYPAYVKPSGLKYILEHRLVMERHLGRYLLPQEVVHHKDMDPRNNDLANLVLFSNQSEHMRRAHPTGAGGGTSS